MKPTVTVRDLCTLFVCTSLVATMGPAPTAYAGVTQEPAPAQAAQPTAESDTEAEAPEVAQAAALSEEAVTRFDAKDYDGAIERFSAAYNLDPNPNYLFNIGRVYEESGNLETAIEYYERFIQQPGVELESRKFASERLKDLREITASRKQPETEAAPQPQPEAPQPATPVDVEQKPKRQPLELAGYGFLATGLAAGIAGGVFGGLAMNKRNSLATTSGFESRQDAIAAGERNALLADILLVSGGVLVVAGVAMVAVGVRKRKAAKKVAFAPERGLAFKF